MQNSPISPYEPDQLDSLQNKLIGDIWKDNALVEPPSEPTGEALRHGRRPSSSSVAVRRGLFCAYPGILTRLWLAVTDRLSGTLVAGEGTSGRKNQFILLKRYIATAFSTEKVEVRRQEFLQEIHAVIRAVGKELENTKTCRLPVHSKN
jgi:hypothetical protein